MKIDPRAGLQATPDMLIDVVKLERDYYDRKPDYSDASQRVLFGTSGHRGTSQDGTFTEAHILAVTQAVCEYRQSKGIDGPILVGKDTHALSAPAQRTALEILAGNGIETMIAAEDGVTPVPVISRAVINYNRSRRNHLADALIATPSHNPPRDGGFKYNPPNGGPADTDVTDWIQSRANDHLRQDNAGVRRVPYSTAIKSASTHQTDFITPYVRDLGFVIDMQAIRDAHLKLGVDPLGGSSLCCWDPINAIYGLDIEVVNRKVDPTFSFMTVDHDGQIRMDCSSPYAMANLVGLKNRFQVAFGNDPDADRHGIVTPSSGLMNPNHYLAVSIQYLLTHRPGWPAHAAIGKTVVSSSMIDRVVAKLGRTLAEVPVGFKWFAKGLSEGTLCFGGEESAGATLLQQDGKTWTTDKDGPVMDLLAAEITARTGKDPGEHYKALTAEFGEFFYTRIDAPATATQKAALSRITPAMVRVAELAGDPIREMVTRVGADNVRFGGLKVITANGWFAARPSGTEKIYKIYAESFRSETHLTAIIEDAQRIVNRAMTGDKA